MTVVATIGELNYYFFGSATELAPLSAIAYHVCTWPKTISAGLH
jgi:hypothetical protein